MGGCLSKNGSESEEHNGYRHVVGGAHNHKSHEPFVNQLPEKHAPQAAWRPTVHSPSPKHVHRADTITGKPLEDVKQHYTLGKELGRGQFGVTYLCTENSTGLQYACKSISKRKLVRRDDKEDMKREIQIMQHLSGQPNIVEFKGSYEDKHSVHVVMELCAGGELFLFRKLLLWLTVLSGLGYAGGVWYSLVSDNFHDFFTEYIPYGEDAVAYFEEREFRRRFPGRAGEPRLHPQISGENKVTIPGRSGLTARPAQENKSDLGSKGPHLSAVDANKKPDSTESSGQQPKVSSGAPSPAPSKTEEKAAPVKEVVKKETPAKPISQLDHLSVPSATEPVVQDVVKIVNDIITVINADNAHNGKYNSALDKAKSELAKVVSDINMMKESLQKQTEDKVAAAHAEFDQAAKELVTRLDHQMQAQEAQFKEEFENERERLSQSYKERLQSELQAAQKVYDQKLKNQLLEQSINMQKSFTANVRERVEAERDGRLGKLNELSSSVHELEKLTGEWNSVVDANLKTQHLVVAVEAVKSALETQATPKPFVTELAALKEIAADDPVVSAAIASINPAAYQRGIPSSALLIDRFRRVAQEVRKAALLPEDAGMASHLASLAMSKVLFKKSGLAVGADVEAVLSRTEVLLEEGDLDAAAREMNGLQGWAKVLSKDWLSECRRVLEVKQALDVIATEARLNSLLID